MLSVMLLKATELGYLAISSEHIFDKACIFAYLRVVVNDILVHPYRMVLDFKKRMCFKGKQTVKLEHYCISIRIPLLCILLNAMSVAMKKLEVILQLILNSVHLLQR